MKTPPRTTPATSAKVLRQPKRISKPAADSKPAITKKTAKPSFLRSPYREGTTMIRVANSLLPTIKLLLAKRKAEAAAGDPDAYE
jgi:hypothetical protein